MVARTPTVEQARVAMQRIDPFLGRYSSAWCRQVLYSTLHHTSGAFDQSALTSEQLGIWFNSEPWPLQQRRDIYDIDRVHWCEDCLKCGYHFFGHQLVGLARCPLHDTPMRCGCPNCEFVLPMRSRFTLECREPLRNCVHCHQSILSVNASFKWPKTSRFLQLEREVLRRFVYWAQRVDRLHYRLAQHTEGPYIGAASQRPSMEQTRLAIEAVCPLPRGIVTELRPSGLVVTMVVLDARLVQETVVPAEVRSMLGKAILGHLGGEPLPAQWVRHWRTFEVETPTPANAGESSHFDCWREQLFTTYSGFKPAGPIESLRPCMLPLLAARLVGQFNDQAKGVYHHGEHDLAASFFFSDREATLANAPLGDLPGIIIELHNGCDYAAFRPGSETDAAGL
ncbi:hypothetical protein [Rhodanobacter umsongensis]